jgi:cytochrome c oxidase cbb3-type subunit I/II
MTLKKMDVMIQLGVPYSESDMATAYEHLKAQAKQISGNILEDPQFAEAYQQEKEQLSGDEEAFIPLEDREIVALIAYMQRLGVDLSTALEQEKKEDN